MFGPATFEFLAALARNNTREWFEANKARYERDVRGPALAFIEAMAPHVAAISPHYLAIARRQGGSLMRPYRDRRFHPDAPPYKLNVGIQFRHEAAASDVHAPGFYVHLEPGGCFLGAGCWRPDARALAAIRGAIEARPGAWQAARDARAFARRYRLAGESLRRPPRGFAADHPHIEDLRRKDFIALQPLDDAELTRPDLARRVARAFDAAAPFVRFLCHAQDLAF